MLDEASETVWNVPNRLSAARIGLAVLCFVLIWLHWYLLALLVFLVAAGTDWLDGYWARTYNQFTQLGRILDPFADKVLICGTFIMLAAESGSQVPAWAAVVVTVRELLVTTLRALVEGRQMDFSAQWAGKWKMVVQCAVVVSSLWRLYGDAAWQAPSIAIDNLVTGLVLAAVGLTVYSGWGYVKLAIEMLESNRTTSDSSSNKAN